MKGNPLYQFRHFVSSLVMLLALAWLTVSLPFVYASQQVHKAVAQEQPADAASDENCNPLSNTTEEKTESGTNSLSEFLHQAPAIEHAVFSISRQYNIHSADTYIAFHPEFICPPPDSHGS
jgi:hypothetical protein